MASRRPPGGLPHDDPGPELRDVGRRLRRGLPPGRRAVGRSPGRRDAARAPACTINRGRQASERHQDHRHPVVHDDTGAARRPASIVQRGTNPEPGRAFGTKSALAGRAGLSTLTRKRPPSPGRQVGGMARPSDAVARPLTSTLTTGRTRPAVAHGAAR